LQLVYPQAEHGLLEARDLMRHHEFMPAGLLASQLTALEPPEPDEHPIIVDAGWTVDRRLRCSRAG